MASLNRSRSFARGVLGGAVLSLSSLFLGSCAFPDKFEGSIDEPIYRLVDSVNGSSYRFNSQDGGVLREDVPEDYSNGNSSVNPIVEALKDTLFTRRGPDWNRVLNLNSPIVTVPFPPTSLSNGRGSIPYPVDEILNSHPVRDYIELMGRFR